MSTEAPSDLKALRASLMQETGLTDPVEVGIVGDAAHAARGGYHISPDDISNAGQFGEYSTRYSRDRHLPNSYASALDLGADWPRGGRSAWLTFNNNVVWELSHHPERLPGLRAVNYTPDGTTKLRYDSAHPDQGSISSADTVDIHTHFEWWRDTIGNRQACMDRIVEHVLIAQGRPIPNPLEDDMFLRTPNGTIYLAAGGRVVALTSGEWSGLKPAQTFVDVAQSVVDKLLAPDAPVQVTLTAEQFADFKSSAVPIVHDAAQSGAQAGAAAALDGATIHPAAT